MKNLLNRTLAFTRMLAISAVLVLPLLAYALPAVALTQQEQRDAVCAGLGGTTQGGTNCATGVNEPSVPDTIRNIANIILFLTGAVAVLMAVIGGFRYVTSSGDSSQTKSARDTILYAVIGIVVAFTAYAIVNFVLSSID